MNKITLGLAAAGLLTSVAANAATLAAGVYASTGTVVGNNDPVPATASSPCASVGLGLNAANNSVITYPGANKLGFNLYVPAGGGLQLCNGFAATPATGGLNFTGNGQCAIYALTFSIPAQPVGFAFQSTAEDANTAIGTTSVAIPAGNLVGGGCNATIATTIVRSGK